MYYEQNWNNKLHFIQFGSLSSSSLLFHYVYYAVNLFMQNIWVNAMHLIMLRQNWFKFILFFFVVKFEFLFLNIHDVNECNNPFALQHVIQLRFSFITAAAFRTTNRKLNEINSKQTVTVCDTHKNSKASWSVYLSNYNDIWSRMKRTTNYNIRDSPIFNDNNNRIICVPDDRAGDRRCMYL